MTISFRRALAVVPVFACLAIAAPAWGRPDRSAPHAAARPATTILVSAWTAQNKPIKQAHVRLRNVISGHLEATAITGDDGQLAFDDIEGGSYLVELVNDAGRILVVGNVFTIAPGETVATFVRLGGKVPWFSSFFGSTLTAVTATAATGGIAALAPVARPVSANQ